MEYCNLNDDYKIVLYHPVKGIKTQKDNECGNYESRFRANIIRKIQYSNDLRFDLVHKNSPHSLLEAMIIDASEKYHSSLYEYESNEQKYLSNFVSKMLVAAGTVAEQDFGQQDICITGGMNFDPETEDRPSLMTEKRFHFHVIVHTKDEYEYVQNNYVLAKNIKDKVYLNRLLDPITLGLLDLMYDYMVFKQPILRQNLLKPSQQEDVACGLPIGLKICLDSFEAFTKPENIALLATIHSLIIDFYSELHLVIVGRDYNKYSNWTRPSLQNFEDIKKSYQNHFAFSNKVNLNKILFMCSQAKEPIQQNMEWLAHYPLVAVNEMLLAGPAYSLSLFQNKGVFDRKNKYSSKVIVAFYPKFISDFGGAGMTSFGGINAIRIKRNQGVFSKDEMARRLHFVNTVSNISDV